MSTSPTPINLNDTTPASPNWEVLVKWQGDNSNPRNVSAYVPFSSPTQAGAMFNVSDLGGTGQDPTVVGITGIEIDQTITPTEDYQAVRFVADGVSDSGIAFGHLKFGHLTGGVDARTTASETIAKSSHASCVTFADVSPAANIAVALDSTVNAHFWCFAQNRTASHNVVFTPSSGTINDGTGPTSTATLAAGSNCALFFNGTNWTILKLSGGGGSVTWGSITGTLSSQTDLQTALDAKLDDSQLDTDGTLAANSDAKISSQKATKTYTDTAVATKMANPMTTQGDIIYGGTSGTPTRLGAGTSGLVLTSNGAGVAPSYQAVGTIGLPNWLKNHPDAYPTSANAMDDEFDAGSVNTSLWTALNSSANMPFTQANGRLIATPNNGGGAVRGYYQAIPAGNWSFGTKVYINPSDTATFSELGGIGLLESSTGKLNVWYVGRLAALNYSAVLDKWTSSGTVFGSRPINQLIGLPPAIYLKITFDGTNYGYYISFDGVAYTAFGIRAATTDFTTAANRVFVGALDDKTSLDNPINWEYFRRLS